MPMKNPGLAAVLSFFITGLGQIYNGQIFKGLVCICFLFLFFFLTWIVIGWVFLVPFWIWGMYDAYRTAERLNARNLAIQSVPR